MPRDLAWKLWNALSALRQPDPALASAIAWLRTVARHDDVIFVDTPSGGHVCRFEFPSGPGLALRPVRRPQRAGTPTMVLRWRGPLSSSLFGLRGVVHSAFNSLSSPLVNEPCWCRTLQLPTIELFERRDRIAGSTPLRYGLRNVEARTLLRLARRAIQDGIGARPRELGLDDATDVLPGRARTRTQAAVALWCGGRLRGSAIAPRSELPGAVAQAALAAVRDRRFKPLTCRELSGVVIQLSVLHEPWVPIAARDGDSRAWMHDKGYVVTRGPRAGCFLPEIFNLRRFRGLADLLETLAREKAGVRLTSTGVETRAFEVDEWLGDSREDCVWPLDGPVPLRSVAVDSRSALLDAATDSAEWLASLVRTTRLPPTRIDPRTGSASGSDVARAALTALGLAHFGRALSHEPSLDGAARLFKLLFDNLESGSASSPGAVLGWIYLGKTALVLGVPDVAARAVAVTRARASAVSAEPLVLAHAVGLLAAARQIEGCDDVPLRDHLRQNLEAGFARARAGGAPISLARWAEAAACWDDGREARARAVADWLARHQLASGAFPNTTDDAFAYTRGTGKVFEVLSLWPERYQGALGRAAAWLCDMQLRDHSLYFVPEEHQPAICGGFRHDRMNPVVWIDGAAHVLLGVSRLATASSPLVGSD